MPPPNPPNYPWGNNWVTCQDLRDRTHRTRPRYRSKRMDAVLLALEKYEEQQTDLNIIAVRDAFRTWYRSDPKEFASRNQISGGLCERLMKEVGLYPPGNLGAPEPDFAAYLISRPTANRGRDIWTGDTFERHACGVASLMSQLKYRHRLNVGVMLIDMLQHGSPEGNGSFVRYNRKSVIENQIDVLQAARQHRMPVFNIALEFPQTRGKLETMSWLMNHITWAEMGNLRIDLYKTDNNTCGVTNKVRAGDQRNTCRGGSNNGNPLRHDMLFRDVFTEVMNGPGGVLVVMGFNANLCVAGTTFGNVTARGGSGNVIMPYGLGLLDLGFFVVTSRTILASPHMPLAAASGWKGGLVGM